MPTVLATVALTYSAYDARVPNRVQVALATTDDLRSFVRHGPMLDRDMRNVVIFPERVGGRCVGLFRPNDDLLGDWASDTECRSAISVRGQKGTRPRSEPTPPQVAIVRSRTLTLSSMAST
jgi:predicted GH43/DUF377 family glycosyl hydrolase